MTQAQVKERFSAISGPHFEGACCQLKWQTGSRVTSGCVKRAISSSRRKTAMESKVLSEPKMSQVHRLRTVEKTTLWEFTWGHSFPDQVFHPSAFQGEADTCVAPASARSLAMPVMQSLKMQQILQVGDDPQMAPAQVVREYLSQTGQAYPSCTSLNCLWSCISSFSLPPPPSLWHSPLFRASRWTAALEAPPSVSPPHTNLDSRTASSYKPVSGFVV